MELMKTSLFDLYKLVYSKPGQRIPEEVLGKIAVSVSISIIRANHVASSFLY
jgi:hypothetical protein